MNRTAERFLCIIQKTLFLWAPVVHNNYFWIKKDGDIPANSSYIRFDSNELALVQALTEGDGQDVRKALIDLRSTHDNDVITELLTQSILQGSANMDASKRIQGKFLQVISLIGGNDKASAFEIYRALADDGLHLKNPDRISVALFDFSFQPDLMDAMLRSHFLVPEDLALWRDKNTGADAVFFSLDFGSPDVIPVLISHGCPVSLNGGSYEGKFVPLFKVIMDLNLSGMLDCLSNQVREIMETPIQGIHPMDYLTEWGNIEASKITDRIKFLISLKSYGVDIHYKKSTDGNSVSDEFVRKFDLEKLEKDIRLFNPDDIKFPDECIKFGVSALHAMNIGAQSENTGILNNARGHESKIFSAFQSGIKSLISESLDRNEDFDADMEYAIHLATVNEFPQVLDQLLSFKSYMAASDILGEFKLPSKTIKP